jgi:ABC-type phosphate transport system substrate-binding protein
MCLKEIPIWEYSKHLKTHVKKCSKNLQKHKVLESNHVKPNILKERNTNGIATIMRPDKSSTRKIFIKKKQKKKKVQIKPKEIKVKEV